MFEKIKEWSPYVIVVVVGLIAWSELGGLYAKARAAVMAKVTPPAA